MRTLIQLGNISKSFQRRLCELEGSDDISVEAAQSAISILARLTEIGDTTMWGEAPNYVVQKVTWLINDGFPEAAIHASWLNCSFHVKDCLNTENPQIISEAIALVHDWLERMKLSAIQKS